MQTPFQTLGLPTILVDPDTDSRLSNATDASISDAIFGDYSVVKRLYGGMGEVIIGKDGNGTPIALKSFQKQFYFDYKIRLLFYNEIKTWSMLSGLPNIMPLLGVKEIEKRLFVIMPAIDMEKPGSGTLRTLLNAKQYSPDELLLYIFQMIRGLTVANNHFQNVVHADLKPENILIQNKNLFISDFGLAKVKNHTDKMLSSDTTWAYKAPELWAQEGQFSIQSDMYALGIILYECVFGSLRIPARTKEEFAHFHQHQQFPFDESTAADPEMQYLIKWCIQKDPQNRPQNYQELNDYFLENILRKYPEQYLELFHQLYHTVSGYESFQRLIKPGVAKALYKIGEYSQALEAMQSIAETHLDKYQLAFLANLLSLNNQDEKALATFDRAIDAGLEGDDLYSCMSDKALSYKRLSRFEEAKKTCLDLISKIPDTNKNLIATVYNTLGTVHIQSKNYQAGIEVLWTLVKKHGIHHAIAYANMGICYAALKESQLAVEHFSRSLQIEPSPEVQTHMARELMFLFRIKEAREQLDLAFDQGYESREWIISMMACCLMLRDEENLQGMIYGIQNNMGERYVKVYWDEADRLIQAIKEKYESQQKNPVPAPRPSAEAPAPKYVVSNQPVDKIYNYICLFIVMKDEYDRDYLDKSCAHYGYLPMDNNSDLFDACFHGFSQNNPDFGRRIMAAYYREYAGGEYLESAQTPVDINDLLNEITQYYPRLESLSTSITKQQLDDFSRMMLQNFKDILNAPRKKPQDYVYLLGFAQRKRPPQEFYEIADKFIMDFPQNLEAWFHSGLKHFQLSEMPRAIDLFEKTFKADPTHLQAAMYLYYCYLQMGDTRNSEKYLAILQRSGMLL